MTAPFSYVTMTLIVSSMEMPSPNTLWSRRYPSSCSASRYSALSFSFFAMSSANGSPAAAPPPSPVPRT